MDPSRRRRIEEYVRPIAVGLDGVTYFGDAERVVRAAERIAGEDASVDRDVVYLLAMFSGQEKWVLRMGQRSRTEIFLTSIGVAEPAMRALFRGLPRLSAAPRTPEEAVVHDALKLESLGATGIARLLLEDIAGVRTSGRWRMRSRRRPAKSSRRKKAAVSPRRGARQCGDSPSSFETNTLLPLPVTGEGRGEGPYRSPCPPSMSRICPVT